MFNWSQKSSNKITVPRIKPFETILGNFVVARNWIHPVFYVGVTRTIIKVPKMTTISCWAMYFKYLTYSGKFVNRTPFKYIWSVFMWKGIIWQACGCWIVQRSLDVIQYSDMSIKWTDAIIHCFYTQPTSFDVTEDRRQPIWALSVEYWFALRNSFLVYPRDIWIILPILCYYSTTICILYMYVKNAKQADGIPSPVNQSKEIANDLKMSKRNGESGRIDENFHSLRINANFIDLTLGSTLTWTTCK